MAIDRNIINWNMESKSFEAKTYIEIFNMLLENYRAIYGSEIDLSAETAFGEELRMNAELYYDFAKLAQDIYYTLDVNNAKGAILDNLVAFTSNMTRRENVQTKLTGVLNWTAEQVIFENDQVYLQDIQGLSWKVIITDGWQTIPDNPNKFVSGSASAELICMNYGENYITEAVLLTKNSSFYSSTVSVTNTIYNQIGSIKETDEMLRNRKNDLLNYNSLSVLDSIRDYILKNIFSIKDVKIYNANGKATVDSDIDLDRDSIISLWMNSTDKLVVKEVGVARHDVLVLIQPQEGIKLDSFINDLDEPQPLSVALAEVIKQKMTPGISTSEYLLAVDDGQVDRTAHYTDKNYISVPLDVVSSTSNIALADSKENYRFYVVNQYSPKITITLQTKNNYDYVTSRKRIRDNIYNLSRSYTINKDIDISEILTEVMKANLDIYNPSFVALNVVVGDVTTPQGVSVNNGYWLVDVTKIGFNIEIQDGKPIEENLGS